MSVFSGDPNPCHPVGGVCTPGGAAGFTCKCEKGYQGAKCDQGMYNLWHHLTHITGKQTLRSLSFSYQKKDGHAWPHPSFAFGMTSTF